MSKYTNYNTVCTNYDSRRVGFGAPELLEQITRQSNKSPRELHILDAGCGTGNYSKALLELGVGKLSLFDASTGMLQGARNKLREFIEEGRTGEIKQGMLPNIPFGNQQFDAVMFNCVLHHLDTDSVETSKLPFPSISAVFREVSRVLKPGGLFAAIDQYPEQYAAQWFVNLVPSALGKFLSRFPNYDQYVAMATKAGFRKPEATKLIGSDWFADYFNPEGPLLKSWRDCDSYWSYLGEGDLEEALNRAQTLIAEGKMGDFVKENDGSMTKGHMTILTARKE